LHLIIVYYCILKTEATTDPAFSSTWNSNKGSVW